jgi:hypothetical protein
VHRLRSCQHQAGAKDAGARHAPMVREQTASSISAECSRLQPAGVHLQSAPTCTGGAAIVCVHVQTRQPHPPDK